MIKWVSGDADRRAKQAREKAMANDGHGRDPGLAVRQ